MSLRERFERLDDRERRLLGVALSIAVLGALLVPPLTLFAVVHTKSSDVQAVRDAIQAIVDEEDTIERAKAEKVAITQRYSRPAPQLQAFLAGLASQVQVEIPESQDRQALPRGKRFEERSTKIVLRKVGMLKLVRFLEKVEQSGHPVRVTQIDIRKRGTEPDSYDVDMIVSAFDRKAPEKPARDGGVAPAASAGDEDSPGEEDDQ